MRPRVPWMNELDDLILEFLSDTGEPGGKPVAISPTQAHVNLNQVRNMTDKAPNTFSRRMANLESIGLLEKVDTRGTYYILTRKGEAYLAGELEADDLE